MKQLQTLLLCLLFPLAVCASAWDDAKYKQIENSIRMPEFADRTFDITKYGASLEATPAQNQKAINKAIEACSKAGGGRAFSCGRHPDEPHRHSVGIKAVPVRRLRRNRTATIQNVIQHFIGYSHPLSQLALRELAVLYLFFQHFTRMCGICRCKVVDYHIRIYSLYLYHKPSVI